MTPYLAPSSSTQSMKRSTLVTPSSTSKMIDLKRMKRNGTSSLTEPGEFVEEEDDESSIIRIYYDGSNALHVNIIQREVLSALFRFVEVAEKTLGGQVSGYKLPIKFEKPIYGGEKTDMIEFVGPGRNLKYNQRLILTEMTFGLMLSAICTSKMTPLALGAGSQLMFCFITGIFWPVETMIAMLRYISYAMPQTKPMESFRHILIGFDLSKPAVLNGYRITVAWIASFLILAIVIFRVK